MALRMDYLHAVLYPQGGSRIFPELIINIFFSVCFQCLNILVQHGTVPDYYEERHVNGKLHGCTCRKGDPQQKVSIRNL